MSAIVSRRSVLWMITGAIAVGVMGRETIPTFANVAGDAGPGDGSSAGVVINPADVHIPDPDNVVPIDNKHRRMLKNLAGKLRELGRQERIRERLRAESSSEMNNTQLREHLEAVEKCEGRITSLKKEIGKLEQKIHAYVAAQKEKDKGTK